MKKQASRLSQTAAAGARTSVRSNCRTLPRWGRCCGLKSALRPRAALLAVGALCGVLGAYWARGATNLVTNTSDSGAGSLRQAISNANFTVNVPDVIQFNIAGAGPHTISPVTPLPIVTDPVTIDGYSQPGASTNTLAQGDNAVLKIVVLDELVIDTTNSTVRGLAVRQIKLGNAPGPKGKNVVEGNFVGLDATGTNSLASPGPGVFVQTPTNRVGGSTPGARNLISGKGAAGVEIFEAFASGNVVQGNYIGTDRTGTNAIGNADRAVVINMSAFGNTIGGTAAGAGNLISGNLNRGITLDGSNNVVQGNFIGTDVTGLQPLGNARTGVEIGGPGNTVGGTAGGAGNVIAFNGVDGGGVFTTNGVDVRPGAANYAILGNSIFDNAGLGIDVNADGLVTTPFPVLTLASNTTSSTVIKGTHTPSTSFRLELFTNPAADPSGYGEGRTLLTSTNLTTDGGGNFTVNWPAALTPGLFVTATANGTTEFSQARMIVAVGRTNSWTNSLSGKWEVASNWSLGVAPYIGHALVLITNAGTKTVTNDATTATSFPTTLTLSNLLISAPTGATNTLLLAQGGTQKPLTILSNFTLNSGGAVAIQNGALRLDGPLGTGLRIDGSATLAGGELLATNSSTQLLVGNNGRGALSVLAGTLRANYVIVGANAGAVGTWQIAGGTNVIAGGAFDLADSLTATGTVWMTGGRLDVPNAYVGLFGNGSLAVSNGVFNCAGTGLIASQDGSQGSFIAAGGTSTFGAMLIRESSLATGSALVTGTGQVQVNGTLDNSGGITVFGGNLNVLGAVTSEAPGNSIRVTGGQFAATNDSSFLTSVTVSNGAFLARDVFLGNQKTGTFAVAAGSVALPGSFNGFNVGVNGGTGTVWQTGGEINLTNTDLNVGGLFSPALGLMTISNGTASALNLFVGGQGGGTGVVTVAGGTLNATNVYVGGSGSQSQLAVSNGATTFTAGNAFLGFDPGANRNSAAVAGPGTRWLIVSNLYVGNSGALNRLTVTNGGLVVNSNAYLGNNGLSWSNLALISGAGTLWSNRQTLTIGQSGSSNRVVVSDGARLECRFATLGANGSSSNNELVVTGPGSFWSIEQNFTLGNLGNGNRLVISNGARVKGSGFIGSLGSSNNEVVVTGPGSAWTNGSTLTVGGAGRANRLIITNGAEVFEQPFGVLLGSSSSSSNNSLIVDGGTLRATNPGGGVLDVRRGTNVLNAGLIEVDTLLLTNALSRFEFNGGTLSARNTRVSNGTLFRAGDGTKPATFILNGNGIHDFTGTLAFTVSSNAALTGNGTIGGPLVLATGGKLIPGTAQNVIGRMIISNSPVLLGTTVLEISKNGAALTNDQAQVNAGLSYGGSLVVSNLGPTALASGDTFRLFVAPSYGGGFTNVSLPALNSGWTWTNRLLVDGSIAVVGPPIPQIGGIVVSGANVIISGTGGPGTSNYWVLASTNVVLPLSNWTRLLTNQFNGAGAFIFSNAIDPSLPRRFYLLQVP
jgi:T5SS/PEP-CTERM-associated repeat protein